MDQLLPGREFRQKPPELRSLLVELRTAGSQDPERFAQAADELSEIRNTTSDVARARLAIVLLGSEVEYKDPVDSWIAHRGGPVVGPTAALEAVLRDSDQVFPMRGLGPASYDVFLDALVENVGDGPVPERTLRTLAHLVTSLEKRAEAYLEEKVREQETPELDRRMAGEFAEVLAQWWERGQFQVVQMGRPVEPGELDLDAVLRTTRAPVQGSVLALPPEQPAGEPEAEVLELYEGIDGRKDTSPGLDRLVELARSDPGQAADLLDRFFDYADIPLLRDYHHKDLSIKKAWDDLRKTDKLLERAETEPALAQLVAPHAGRLARIASAGAALGSAGRDNIEVAAKVSVLKRVSRLFPDQADERFVREELLALVDTDYLNSRWEVYNHLVELWEARPQLIDPTVQELHRRRTEPPITQFWNDHGKLYREAYELGWRPDDQQLRDLVAELYVPPGRVGNNLWSSLHSDGLQHVVRLLGRIQEDNPERLEGLELPGPELAPAPWRRAVVQGLMHAQPNNFDPLTRRDLEGLSELLLHDPTLRPELVDQVVAAGGELGWRERMALQILDPERLESDEARLLASLEPLLSGRTKGNLDFQLIPYRAAHLSALCRRLDNEETARVALRLAERQSRSSGDGESLNTILDTLARTTFELSPQLADEVGAYLQPGLVEDLPQEARLSLALMASRPEGRERLVAVLGDQLHQTGGEELTRTVLRRLRADLRSGYRQRIEAGTLPEPARNDLTARTVERSRVDRLSEATARDLAAAWLRGLPAGAALGGLAQVLAGFTDKEAQAFHAGLQEAKESRPELPWARFEHFLSLQSGPSPVTAAARCEAAMESYLAAGVSEPEAMARVMRAISLDVAPSAATGGKVTVTEEAVDVNGFQVPVER